MAAAASASPKSIVMIPAPVTRSASRTTARRTVPAARQPTSLSSQSLGCMLLLALRLCSLSSASWLVSGSSTGDGVRRTRSGFRNTTTSRLPTVSLSCPCPWPRTRSYPCLPTRAPTPPAHRFTTRATRQDIRRSAPTPFSLPTCSARAPTHTLMTRRCSSSTTGATTSPVSAARPYIDVCGVAPAALIFS